ncbi:50S ribosomal protein L23 [Verrucomicrobiota bacterium]
MKDLSSVITKIQITEKGTDLAGRENKYLFRVATSANKIDVKRAVEKIYGVTVTGVNTMNYLGKKKRERTRNYGKREDWKRAVVTLKEGDKIDLT